MDHSPSGILPMQPRVSTHSRKEKAAQWILEYHHAAKEAFWAYCDNLYRAQALSQSSSSSQNYNEIEAALSEIQKGMEVLNTQSPMTSSFLKNSAISFDFSAPIYHLLIPKEATLGKKSAIRALRQKARKISSQLLMLRHAIEEVDMQLEEDGGAGEMEVEIDGFLSLVGTDATSDTVSLEIGNPLIQQPGHVEESGIPSNADDGDDDDDDDDDEDEYYNGRPCRDLDDIDFEESEPIWVVGEPEPEGLPDKVKEIIELDGTDGRQAIGSMRTIFYWDGYDNLVSLIDDDACALEDTVEVIPVGTLAGSFLLDKYSESGKIPWCIIDRYMSWPELNPRIPLFPVFDVPSAVTSNPETHRIADLYPNTRRQCLPESVRIVRLPRQKLFPKFETAVDNAFHGALFKQSELLFRGLSLRSLGMLMSVFLPVITSNSSGNEFDPGIYTTKIFKTAYDYSKITGAIMVFKNTDYRDLNVWAPDNTEWDRLVRNWVGTPPKDVAISPRYEHADLIKGPMSTAHHKGKKKENGLVQDLNVDESVFISYKACEKLMASLRAIIYVEA